MQNNTQAGIRIFISVIKTLRSEMFHPWSQSCLNLDLNYAKQKIWKDLKPFKIPGLTISLFPPPSKAGSGSCGLSNSLHNPIKSLLYSYMFLFWLRSSFQNFQNIFPCQLKITEMNMDAGNMRKGDFSFLIFEVFFCGNKRH